MKRAVLGIVLGAGLAVAGVAVAEQGGEFLPQRATMPTTPGAAVAAGSELIVVSTPLGENKDKQMLTVVDPRQQVICVYHIDLSTGKIALKSVRKIEWDLQITDFNTGIPLPQEIQSRLKPR